jgi:hypothetical protein
VAIAAAAGCSAVTELLQLTDRIQREGYTSVEVFHSDSFGTTAASEVQIDAGVGRGEPAPAGQQEIAEIVWTTYPRRFDLVTIDLSGDQASFDRRQLEALFGPRDPSLDEQEFSDDLTSGLRTAGIVALVGLVVVLAGVLLLVRRARRRRREQWGAPAGPAGYATYGPGYGPPAQPYPPPPAPPPPFGHPPPPHVGRPPPDAWPPPPPFVVPPAPGAPPPPSTPPPPSAPPPVEPPDRSRDWPPPPQGGPSA